jgi:hypothetical protein
MTLTHRIEVNRNPTYAVYEVWVPDGGHYWKKIRVFRTRKDAENFIAERDSRA